MWYAECEIAKYARLIGTEAVSPLPQERKNVMQTQLKSADSQISISPWRWGKVTLLCPNQVSLKLHLSSSSRVSRAALPDLFSSFCCLATLIGLKVWLSVPLCIHAWIHWYKCKHMFGLFLPLSPGPSEHTYSYKFFHTTQYMRTEVAPFFSNSRRKINSVISAV